MKDKIFVFSTLLSGLFLGGCEKKAEEEKNEEFVQNDVAPEESVMSEEGNVSASGEEAALPEEGQIEPTLTVAEASGSSDPALDTVADEAGSVSGEG